MHTLLARTWMTTRTSAHDLADLARTHGRHVYLTAYRVLGDSGLAEDVQQDVFMRLLENVPDDVQSWPAFLAALATRLAIDRLRRRARWRNLLPRWLVGAPQPQDTTEQVAVDAERAAQLRGALAKLGGRDAECFALRYVEGFDVPDIAAALGISTNLVSVTLHRAKQKLRALLLDATETTSQETSR
ncbi:MAG TPA: sigma-70 family RNA polymerase sigma factor [Xanthomonadales bacterium]|nr:sigma-70 family RNA polymerase sigma factor [Xanthomonadales bacterium]